MINNFWLIFLISKHYLSKLLGSYILIKLIDFFFFSINLELILIGTFSLIIFNQIDSVTGLFVSWNLSSIPLTNIFILTNTLILVMLNILVIIEFVIFKLPIELKILYELNSTIFFLSLFGSVISISKFSQLGRLFKIPFGTVTLYVFIASTMLFLVQRSFFISVILLILLFVAVLFMSNDKVYEILRSSKYMILEKDLAKLKEKDLYD